MMWLGEVDFSAVTLPRSLLLDSVETKVKPCGVFDASLSGMTVTSWVQEWLNHAQEFADSVDLLL